MESSTLIMRRGFTLVEAALAIVIIGFGVTATMMMCGHSVIQRTAADDQTLGLNLALNTLEAFKLIPYHNLKDLDGQTFAVGNDAVPGSQPVITVPCQDGYRQRLNVDFVDSDQPSIKAADQTADTGAVLIEVIVEQATGKTWRTIYTHATYSFSG